ncbi:copper-binding protein [Phenylobacterium sp.]|uniref:copper-binding protein n=1 Tax=Phenylobacterium sp. TaxID=1871053 RepID=UPI00120A224A|nr:copper-binding protein [Phenylobacterium sp.]THD58782.1 MAG: copper-binding protein [Phenylobacterium sp.]
MILRTAVLSLVLLAAAAPAALAQAPADAAAAQPPAGRTAQGTGVVASIDAAGGTVQLKHDPIPALGWPSMTMDFKAAPALIAKLKVGQKIAFDVSEGHGVPEITAIRKP